MGLNLPQQPERLYETNPLKLVLAQLRFPPLLGFEATATLAPFQRALADEYPMLQEEQQVAFAINAEGIAATPQNKVWRFRTIDGGRSIVLARDFVGLEATNYTMFTEFASDFRRAVAALGALDTPPKVFQRLGLRYLNELRHEEAHKPSDWKPFLNEELLGLVGGDLLGDAVSQAVQEIRLNDDGVMLIVRHGYFGPEATDNKPFYLIDLDCFSEATGEVEEDQILDRLREFHERVHNLFELSLTDAMRGYLGVKTEELAGA
jgi:uncharacterized protein (TIGR04255 family)